MFRHEMEHLRLLLKLTKTILGGLIYEIKQKYYMIHHISNQLNKKMSHISSRNWLEKPSTNLTLLTLTQENSNA